MTREEYMDFANALKNNYTIDFDKLPEFCDMAISALAEELSEDGTLTVHVSDGSKVSRVFVKGDNIFGGLYYPDSAKTDTAKPEEGAELIDRRQIKWYGCDHEGHIKGINCDTADCSKCFFATVEHDEVMSLPVYRIPDSAENKGELISRQAVNEVLYDLGLGDEENGGDPEYMSALYDCKESIDKIPSAFEGMTNGEVIQTMFPNSKTETISFNGIRLYIDDEVHTKIADFTYRWWNSPYKGVSE